MSDLMGALIGAAIDRRDGDSGIKGAIVGTIAEKAIRIAGPIAATYALGWLVQRGIHKGWQAIAGAPPLGGRTDASPRS